MRDIQSLLAILDLEIYCNSKRDFDKPVVVRTQFCFLYYTLSNLLSTTHITHHALPTIIKNVDR